ncbi:MAG: TIM barrel protein [Clostridia bacterium]
MAEIKFGPSGKGEIFYKEGFLHTTDMPIFLKNHGLDCFEYSFGRGYTMSAQTAKEIGDACKQKQILISAHAPYYINFAQENEQSVEKSFKYVLDGLKMLEYFGGQRLVVHPASCGKMKREFAFELTKKRFADLAERVKNFPYIKDKFICPETMGKTLQIGTYKEVVDICSLSDKFLPCFDFGHINSVTFGGLKIADDYNKIFDYCNEKLGEFRTKNCHIHFSKIEFGAKGELRHLDFSSTQFGPDFSVLADVIVKRDLTPYVICESKDFMVEDAITMKKMYENALKLNKI